jgi:hypothetical protein
MRRAKSWKRGSARGLFKRGSKRRDGPEDNVQRTPSPGRRRPFVSRPSRRGQSPTAREKCKSSRIARRWIGAFVVRRYVAPPWRRRGRASRGHTSRRTDRWLSVPQRWLGWFASLARKPCRGDRAGEGKLAAYPESCGVGPRHCHSDAANQSTGRKPRCREPTARTSYRLTFAGTRRKIGLPFSVNVKSARLIFDLFQMNCSA